MTKNKKTETKKSILKANKKDKMISFRLNNKLFDRIAKESKKNKISKSEYLEKIIIHSFEAYKIEFPPSSSEHKGVIRRPMGFQKL